jgi:hypothetical protein
MKQFLCKLGLHYWEYSLNKKVRYCIRIGCGKRQYFNGVLWFDDRRKQTTGEERNNAVRKR